MLMFLFFSFFFLFFAESDIFSVLTCFFPGLLLGHRSTDYSYSHVAISPTQASPWCPRWSLRRTAAAWRSSSTSSLWTSTRPSRNETSAPTPAPCWTLSSDTKRQATEIISNIFIQSFDQCVCGGGEGKRFKIGTSKNKRRTRSCSAAWSLSLKTASSLL